MEQPVASTNDIPVGSEQVIQELKGELERTKAQLVEKEQELTNKTGKISQLERDRLSSENRRLKNLNNKNEKSSRAISPGRELSNCASACFILLGVCAVVACLVIEDSPEMSAFFAALALIAFLLGCFSLYEANKRDIGPGDATDNPRITRVLPSSPNFAESSYTY